MSQSNNSAHSSEYFEALLEGTTPGLWRAQIDDTPFYVAPPNGNHPVICDLWLAPTKGGIFTTKEREQLQNLPRAPEQALEVV